jgi:hypothetical protein
MSLESIYALSEPDGAFFKRVVVAVAQAATDVRNEWVDDPPTELQLRRKAWGQVVDASPPDMAGRMIWRVLENPSIQTTLDESTDNDIKFVVNGLVDTFAYPPWM